MNRFGLGSWVVVLLFFQTPVFAEPQSLLHALLSLTLLQFHSESISGCKSARGHTGEG